MTSSNWQKEFELTGVVVAYNDSERLPRCLTSLQFCDHLLVVDLGSTDTSIAIARQFTKNILHHQKVDIVEVVRDWVAQFINTDWVLFIDPDEIVPECLGVQLKEILGQGSNVGLIRVPWQFFFAGKPLTTTIWGRVESSKPAIIHKERVQLDPYVHRGYRLLPGFIDVSIPRTACNAIEHYWVDDYRQWFEKHRKYISFEGESRYAIGQRFSWIRMALNTLWDLKLNLWDYHGLSGGWTGISLSFLHAWYTLMCWLSLHHYQDQEQLKS